MSTVRCHVCCGSGVERHDWEAEDPACEECDGEGQLESLRHALWVGDLLGGERLRMPENSCPVDPTVEPSIVAALNHWLDSLPDSPQAATLAGRMAKIKNRLAEGTAP